MKHQETLNIALDLFDSGLYNVLEYIE